MNWKNFFKIIHCILLFVIFCSVVILMGLILISIISYFYPFVQDSFWSTKIERHSNLENSQDLFLIILVLVIDLVFLQTIIIILIIMSCKNFLSDYLWNSFVFLAGLHWTIFSVLSISLFLLGGLDLTVLGHIFDYIYSCIFTGGL